jgi:hypothetical protein
MRHLALVLVLLALGAVLVASCEQSGYRPAYAIFRFTDVNGQPIQIVGQRPQSTHEPGVVLKRNPTVLPDGRKATQEVVVIDPLELPASEYKVTPSPDGLISVTGGSLKDYVITAPKFP